MNKENLGRKVFSWLIDYSVSLREAKAGIQGKILDAWIEVESMEDAAYYSLRLA